MDRIEDHIHVLLDVPKVAAYIQGQREHPRLKTFQEECPALLKKHEIE